MSLSLPVHASSLGSSLMTVALFVAVLVHFILNANPVPMPCVEPPDCGSVQPTNGVVAEECPTNDACAVGYYFPDYGICIPKTVPNGTACTNVCYVDDAETTACNQHGVCEGDPSECRGFCEANSDCNASIPLNPVFVDDLGGILWNYRYLCVAARCELFTLDLYWQQEPLNYGETISGYLRCEDFLNVTWAEERADCLFQEDFLLDHNFTDGFFPDNTPARPSQFRMCTFHYKCAPFDPDLLKRTLDEYDDTDAVEAHALRRLSVAKEMFAETMTAKKRKRSRRH